MLARPSAVLRSAVLACASMSIVACDAAANDASAEQAGKGAPPTASAASAKSSSTAPLKLKKLEVHDPGIGCTAFTLLVPESWKYEGGVVWQHQYANVASGRFKVSDPKSAAALEVFPIIPACWDESTLGAGAQGQNYMGSLVYPPPRDPLGYVQQYFVPGYRASARNLKVGAQTLLPDVAREVHKSSQEPGVEKQVTAGKVRLEYEENGKPIAEDVYITLIVSRSPMVPTMTSWSLEHQYSLRAEKERLDSLAPLLHAMVSSMRLELAWYAGYGQVVQLWRQGQMQSIRDAGELSRRISANNDAILASMRSAWQTRQASQDRMSREFSESIRGVETYAQPYEEREIQLPSGYRDVWTNRAGEYVFSNDSGYDPNVGATNEWRRLEPVK
jgi:hypothetical protein